MGVIARMWAIGGLSAVLVGCLFPSFDRISGTGIEPSSATAPGDAGSDANGTQTSGSSSTSSSSSSSSTSSSGGPTTPSADDAGDGGGGPTKPVIKCGSTSCAFGSSYCCVSENSSACHPSSETRFCKAALDCDESSDCGTGKRCCLGVLGTYCTADADCGPTDDLACNPDKPDCPSPKTCKAGPSSGGTTSFICN